MLLIAVEGIDASGKATVAKTVGDKLGAHPLSFPAYETSYGRAIKQRLQGLWKPEVTPEGLASQKFGPTAVAYLDALVFQALQTANKYEFAEHIRRVQRESARDIVCDRYLLSAVAYGGAEGISQTMLLEGMRAMPQPHLHILMDLPVSAAMERIKARAEKRGEAPDMNESRRDYLARCAEIYRMHFDNFRAMHPEEWVIIDATEPPAVVANKVFLAIAARRAFTRREAIGINAGSAHL